MQVNYGMWFILYYTEDQISLRNVYFASVPTTLLLSYVYLPKYCRNNWYSDTNLKEKQLF